MQDGGRDRDGVDPDVGEDLRGGQRMRDVRLAGNATLAVMSHLGHLEGRAERCHVCLRVVMGYCVADVAESRLRGRQHDQSET